MSEIKNIKGFEDYGIDEHYNVFNLATNKRVLPTTINGCKVVRLLVGGKPLYRSVRKLFRSTFSEQVDPSGEIKRIKGFEDYGVTLDGEVWSFKRDAPTQIKVWEYTYTYTSKTVKLCKNGVAYTRSVPHLIDGTFNGSES